MADPLSTIASILAILDATTAVYTKVHDAKRLPQAFQKIYAQMSLAWDILAEADEKYKLAPGQDANNIQATLDICEQDASELQKMYTVVCEHIDSNWLLRYKRHISNLAHGRKEKVEDLWKRILETLQTLTSYHIFHNLPTPSEKLVSAIAEIEEVEDSASEQGVGATYNYHAPVGVSHSGPGKNEAKVTMGNTYDNGAQHLNNITNNYGKDPNEDYRNCLQALFVTDPAEDYDKARRCTRDGQTERTRYGQAPGTCRWIETDMTPWRDAKPPALLLLTGEPGIGKTIVATHLVDVLKRDSDPKHLAYFFCNNNSKDSTRNSAESMLRSLLWMLLKQDQSLFKHFETEHKAKGLTFCQSRRILWSILKAIVTGSASEITILIDAFDECEQNSRGYLLQEISSWMGAFSGSAAQIKIIILSRPDHGLEGLTVADPWKKMFIRMTPKKIGEDLSKFVDHELERLNPPSPAKPRWSPKVEKEAKAILSENTGGTFLWVSLALDSLDGVTSGKVVSTLKEFPSELKDVYQRILDEIPSKAQDDARRALHVVLSAMQPFTFEALAIALCFVREKRRRKNLPDEFEVEDARNVIRACNKLLRLPGEDEGAREQRQRLLYEYDRAAALHVTIIHQSVKDFLTELAKDHPWSYSLDNDAERQIESAHASYFKCSEIISAAEDALRIYKELQSVTLTSSPIRHSPSGLWAPVARTIEFFMYDMSGQRPGWQLNILLLERIDSKSGTFKCASSRVPELATVRWDLLHAAVVMGNTDMAEVMARSSYLPWHPILEELPSWVSNAEHTDFKMLPYAVSPLPSVSAALNTNPFAFLPRGDQRAREDCFDQVVKHSDKPLHFYASAGKPLWAFLRCLTLKAITPQLCAKDCEQETILSRVFADSRWRRMAKLEDTCESCFHKDLRCNDYRHVLRKCVVWQKTWAFESWLQEVWTVLEARRKANIPQDDSEAENEEQERKLLQEYIRKGWFTPERRRSEPLIDRSERGCVTPLRRRASESMADGQLEVDECVWDKCDHSDEGDVSEGLRGDTASFGIWLIGQASGAYRPGWSSGNSSTGSDRQSLHSGVQSATTLARRSSVTAQKERVNEKRLNKLKDKFIYGLSKRVRKGFSYIVRSHGLRLQRGEAEERCEQSTVTSSRYAK